MIGTILNNRYELLEKIGEGGMSVVYKAKCHKLNRYDAVKILKREYSNDEAVVEKFKREATAVANLSDTNIINIFDVGTQGDIHYIVMEYVKGKTLKDVIIENVRLSYERAIDIGIQIAKALDCAHRNNIIHRDVKPQNILLTEDGVVKVTDFGIAKASSSVTITNSNKVIGSAHYFSPEQAKGSFVDGRADIYSLGIVLYEMVTGKVPFDAESPVTIAIKHIQDNPVPPRQINMSIPESLNRLILKSIEKDPNSRYQTVREMLNDLMRIQKDLNYEIVPSAAEKDYTKVMNAVNVSNQTSKDDEDEYKEDKMNNKTKKILIGVLIGVLILVLGAVTALALGGAFKGGNKPNTNPNQTVVTADKEVPNVIGYTEADAKKKIEESGLKYLKSDEVSDDKIPAGSVVATFPDAGTKLPANKEVRVRLSKGPGKDTVPPLAGMTVEQAKALLASTGFELVTGSNEYNDTVPENSIIRQTPEPDAEADKGTKITVVVSLGKKIVIANVPKLVGLTIDEAKDKLTAVKLKIGATDKVENYDLSKAGKIASQGVQENAPLQQDSAVNVTYYDDVKVPNFVGKTLSQALADPAVKSGAIKLVAPALTDDNKDLKVTLQDPNSVTNTVIKQVTTITLTLETPKTPTP